MTASGKLRGHAIEYRNDEWVFADTGEPLMLSDERLAEIRFDLEEMYSISQDIGYELLNHIDAQAAELDKLRAERERLRAAHKAVVEFDADFTTQLSWRVQERWERVWEEFRSALADAPGGKE